VRAELIELQHVGYVSRGQERDYPADIQSAQAKVAAQRAATGGVVRGSSDAGRLAVPNEPGD
jgi:hypothetical protein